MLGMKSKQLLFLASLLCVSCSAAPEQSDVPYQAWNGKAYSDKMLHTGTAGFIVTDGTSPISVAKPTDDFIVEGGTVGVNWGKVPPPQSLVAGDGVLITNGTIQTALPQVWASGSIYDQGGRLSMRGATSLSIQGLVFTEQTIYYLLDATNDSQPSTYRQLKLKSDKAPAATPAGSLTLNSYFTKSDGTQVVVGASPVDTTGGMIPLRDSTGGIFVSATPSDANHVTNKAYVDSVALPVGGTTGQVLVKNSNADRDAGWLTLSGTSEGTSNYDSLQGRPELNSVVVSGNHPGSYYQLLDLTPTSETQVVSPATLSFSSKNEYYASKITLQQSNLVLGIQDLSGGEYLTSLQFAAGGMVFTGGAILNGDLTVAYGKQILFNDNYVSEALIGYHDYGTWTAVEVGAEEKGLTLNTYDRQDGVVNEHILVNYKSAALPSGTARLLAYLDEIPTPSATGFPVMGSKASIVNATTGRIVMNAFSDDATAPLVELSVDDSAQLTHQRISLAAQLSMQSIIESSTIKFTLSPMDMTAFLYSSNGNILGLDGNTIVAKGSVLSLETWDANAPVPGTKQQSDLAFTGTRMTVSPNQPYSAQTGTVAYLSDIIAAQGGFPSQGSQASITNANTGQIVVNAFNTSGVGLAPIIDLSLDGSNQRSSRLALEQQQATLRSTSGTSYSSLSLYPQRFSLTSPGATIGGNQNSLTLSSNSVLNLFLQADGLTYPYQLIPSGSRLAVQSEDASLNTHTGTLAFLSDIQGGGGGGFPINGVGVSITNPDDGTMIFNSSGFARKLTIGEHVRLDGEASSIDMYDGIQLEVAAGGQLTFGESSDRWFLGQDSSALFTVFDFKVNVEGHDVLQLNSGLQRFGFVDTGYIQADPSQVLLVHGHEGVKIETLYGAVTLQTSDSGRLLASHPAIGTGTVAYLSDISGGGNSTFPVADASAAITHSSSGLLLIDSDTTSPQNGVLQVGEDRLTYSSAYGGFNFSQSAQINLNDNYFVVHNQAAGDYPLQVSSNAFYVQTTDEAQVMSGMIRIGEQANNLQLYIDSAEVSFYDQSSITTTDGYAAVNVGTPSMDQHAATKRYVDRTMLVETARTLSASPWFWQGQLPTNNKILTFQFLNPTHIVANPELTLYSGTGPSFYDIIVTAAVGQNPAPSSITIWYNNQSYVYKYNNAQVPCNMHIRIYVDSVGNIYPLTQGTTQ
jgi:hypothetical protein